DRVCGCDHKTYSNACEAASYGATIASKGECVLPTGGPCTSQDDCGGESYAKVVYCARTSCNGNAGTCVEFPTACPTIYIPVCGCGGATYPNTCFSNLAQATIDYFGPCRDGSFAPCASDGSCPDGRACVDDPRAGCDAGTCPGICVTSPSGCGPV